MTRADRWLCQKYRFFGEDYNLLQNTISNSGTTYTVSFQSVANQQFLNANNITVTKPIASKTRWLRKTRVRTTDAEKDITENRVETTTNLSTTITPVCAYELVTKQPLNAKNNLNANETNRQKQKQSECLSPSKSPKQTPPTNQNNKRPNPSSSVSSPSKMRVSFCLLFEMIANKYVWFNIFDRWTQQTSGYPQSTYCAKWTQRKWTSFSIKFIQTLTLTAISYWREIMATFEGFPDVKPVSIQLLFW